MAPPRSSFENFSWQKAGGNYSPRCRITPNLLDVQIALEFVQDFIFDQSGAVDADQLGAAGGSAGQHDVEVRPDAGHELVRIRRITFG